MIKHDYTAPQAEWLEAENADCFLVESPGGTIPSLTEEEGYGTIIW
ncbi:MAG: hypothetical protein IKX67_05945 [Bacteroidales bacterium]|nr:hypothetical protein [Bacteroidales bacterium]